MQNKNVFFAFITFNLSKRSWRPSDIIKTKKGRPIAALLFIDASC